MHHPFIRDCNVQLCLYSNSVAVRKPRSVWKVIPRSLIRRIYLCLITRRSNFGWKRVRVAHKCGTTVNVNIVITRAALAVTKSASASLVQILWLLLIFVTEIC